MRNAMLTLLLVLLLGVPGRANQGENTTFGKVISVTDGDTVTALVEMVPIRIRMEGIDAPENSQSFGAKSSEHLKALALGKSVTIRKSGTDKYGRTLAFLVVDGVELNAKMVEDGFAWHYKKYNNDKNLASLEAEARKQGRGLWKDKAAIPPWEFRERKKSKASPKVPLGEASEDASQTNPVKRDVPPLSNGFWLNTSSNVRHNPTCEHFKNTKRGRMCNKDDGKACGICGG